MSIHLVIDVIWKSGYLNVIEKITCFGLAPLLAEELDKEDLFDAPQLKLNLFQLL